MAWDDDKSVGDLVRSQDWDDMVAYVKSLLLRTGGTMTGAFILAGGAFADGDATPDVSSGNVFLTANTSPTTITDFDGGVNRQIISVEFGDINTTIQAGASIRMQGGIVSPTNDFGAGAIGDTIWFHYNGTQWIENGRSLNS